MKKYFIYYDIATPYYDGEKVCGAEDFVKFFDAEPADDIELHINCYGGEIAPALAMLAAIERHEGKVTAIIDGVAASCASWLALACDEIKMAQNSEIFIHRASVYIWGNAEDLEKEAVLLRSYDERIAKIYKAKAKDETTDFVTMMAKETTLTAEDCAKIWYIEIQEAPTKPTNQTRYKAVAAKCNHKPKEANTDPVEEEELIVII